MKAEHRKELETNALAKGVGNLWERTKTGRLFTSRAGGLILLVLLVGIVAGVWYYAHVKSRQADSKSWATLVDLFHSGAGPSSLDEFAEGQKGATPGKVARLERAREQLGPEGLALMRDSDRTRQTKGIENVEKARDELKALADEFKGDPAMQASCLTSAAEAELALVGIPKSATNSEDRGSVKAAAELYRQAARAVGENTPVGEKAIKRADDLEAKAADVKAVGDRLYTLVAPPPGFTFPPPGGGLNPAGPKPPEGPITIPKAPEGTPPAEGPKAPEQPLNPAAGITGGVSAAAPPAPPKAPLAPPPTPGPNKK